MYTSAAAAERAAATAAAGLGSGTIASDAAASPTHQLGGGSPTPPVDSHGNAANNTYGSVKQYRRLSVQKRDIPLNNLSIDLAAKGYAAPAPSTGRSSATATSAAKSSGWHGLRIRVGVHHGLGDIRKDPITQGYDYYGTVVNTAARVEGVGHGGQTLLTESAYEAAGGQDCAAFGGSGGSVLIALGPQPLRGLDEPIKLYQIVPNALKNRRFPPLRLHVEKEDESSATDPSASGTGTGLSGGAASAEDLVARLCASKQFSASVTAAELMDRYLYFHSAFGPTPDKYKASVMAKLGAAWGIDKATVAAAGSSSDTAAQTRLAVALVGRMTKAFNVSAAGRQNKQKRGAKGRATIASRTNGTATATNNTTGGGGAAGGTTYAESFTRDGTVNTAGVRRASGSTVASLHGGGGGGAPRNHSSVGIVELYADLDTSRH